VKSVVKNLCASAPKFTRRGGREIICFRIARRRAWQAIMGSSLPNFGADLWNCTDYL
jgi:hypothetical protein